MRVPLAIALATFAWFAAQAQQTYKARLSTVPIDAQTRATIAGDGAITATLNGAKLVITGSFQGMKSAATAAKLHQSPVTGVRGPAVLDVTIIHATNGAINATVDLSPQQVESLKAGKLYLQIDSEKAPDGNLWGWLLR